METKITSSKQENTIKLRPISGTCSRIVKQKAPQQKT